MIRTLMAIAAVRVKTLEYHGLTLIEQWMKHWVDNVDRWLSKLMEEVLQIVLIAIVIIGWMFICQLIADSRVNWREPSYGSMEICEGIVVEVIYLE